MSSDDHLRPRFHRGVTFFLALLLSLSVCFTGSALSLRRSLVLEHPAETARQHFERTIELEAALESEPAWMRRTLLLFLGRVRPALSEAIEAYDEVVEQQARALHEAKVAEKTETGSASGSSSSGASASPPGAVARNTAPDEDGTRTSPPASGAEPPASATRGEAKPATANTSEKAGEENPKASPTGSFLACAPGEPEFPPKDSRADLCELLARRAILEGEAGRAEDVLLTAVRVEGLGLVDVARAIRYAYQRLEPRTQAAFADFRLDELGPGWARDRLELRLARRTGDTQRTTELEAALDARAEVLRAHAEELAWSLAVPAVLGLLALLVWLVRDRPALPRSSAAIPPAWGFEDGLAVLLRALVFGFAMLALVGIVGNELVPAWSPVLASLLVPIPLLVLFQRGLVVPRVLSFFRILGLDAFPGGAWRWAAIVLGLFAADQLGQALILELCGRVGLGLHWTEPVPESLLRAPQLAFLGVVVLGVTWDPLVTELTRRGLLFLTLRARMPAFSATLWSAALVAAFQNGSLPSFFMIAWSSFLYAWTFETTRSILPAVIVQVLAYAGTFGAISAFYR